MNGEQNGVAVDEEAIAEIYAELEAMHDVLVALLSNETASYHDARTQTYRRLIEREQRRKKYLPELPDSIPF